MLLVGGSKVAVQQLSQAGLEKCLVMVADTGRPMLDFITSLEGFNPQCVEIAYQNKKTAGRILDAYDTLLKRGQMGSAEYRKTIHQIRRMDFALSKYILQQIVPLIENNSEIIKDLPIPGFSVHNGIVSILSPYEVGNEGQNLEFAQSCLKMMDRVNEIYKCVNERYGIEIIGKDKKAKLDQLNSKLIGYMAQYN